ncbi:hypothetical protein SO802_012914 [Lithocarpus litseifolius]|uniref:Uncharacterized protein n=1 Tax=Lithocarpus litseifolius TaxID=425828 RepID=A0AAW2D6N3_9ROSI
MQKFQEKENPARDRGVGLGSKVKFQATQTTRLFIQQKLGGPSVSEYEMLQAELSNLQIKYDELLAEHQETCKELVELKNSHSMAVASTKETIDGEAHRDGF